MHAPVRPLARALLTFLAVHRPGCHSWLPPPAALHCSYVLAHSNGPEILPIMEAAVSLNERRRVAGRACPCCTAQSSSLCCHWRVIHHHLPAALALSPVVNPDVSLPRCDPTQVEARAELLPVLRSSRDVLYLDLALEGGCHCTCAVALFTARLLGSGCCTWRWRVGATACCPAWHPAQRTVVASRFLRTFATVHPCHGSSRWALLSRTPAFTPFTTSLRPTPPYPLLAAVVRAAAERGAGHAGLGAAAFVAPLLLNLALSLGDNEEVCYCLKVGGC